MKYIHIYIYIYIYIYMSTTVAEKKRDGDWWTAGAIIRTSLNLKKKLKSKAVPVRGRGDL
jgi:hypothetical protein